MLIDVPFCKPEPQLRMMLELVGGPDIMPKRFGKGLYLFTHWAIDMLTPVKRDYSSEIYGVCDTPEQAVQRAVPANDSPMFVAFVRIIRANEPASGGWRWHKWGPYIGDQKPEHEYLYDDRHIDEIYTYHIYEPGELP
jgi:hypothetical protein